MLDGECWTLDVGPVPLAPTGKRGHKDTRCVCVRILVRVEMAAREQVSLCVFIDVPWSPQNHTLVKGHWKLPEDNSICALVETARVHSRAKATVSIACTISSAHVRTTIDRP